MEKLSGRVIEEIVGTGSKSERRAILLDTGNAKLILRRQGANPFSDPLLDEYLGKIIRGTGNLVAGNTFIVSDIAEIED